MKQFKRGFRRCNDCHTDMCLETAEAAERNGRAIPLLVCSKCGSTAPWAEIADKTCACGATPVQREYALSAPEHGVRLYVTELSKMLLFHQDGRGLEAREACTACTDCFVCKQPVATQDCAWDEIPLEGMDQHKGLTHQYVYLHPDCSTAYQEWSEVYRERLLQKEADRESEAERREYCIGNALCLECEKPLGILNRFVGRLRHSGCPVKKRTTDATSKTKKSGNTTAKRER